MPPQVSYYLSIASNAKRESFLSHLWDRETAAKGNSEIARYLRDRAEGGLVAMKKVFTDALSTHLAARNLAANNALIENVVLITLCNHLRIPLFIVGRPGSSKSLGRAILADVQKGNDSEQQLWRGFGQPLSSAVVYQCSPHSTAEGVTNTFKNASAIQRAMQVQQEREAMTKVLQTAAAAQVVAQAASVADEVVEEADGLDRTCVPVLAEDTPAPGGASSSDQAPAQQEAPVVEVMVVLPNNPIPFTSVAVLDEVGLAEDSLANPLKVLHALLDWGVDPETGKFVYTDEGAFRHRVGVLGLSNWALDPAKMNRAIVVARGAPDAKELELTAGKILFGCGELGAAPGALNMGTSNPPCIRDHHHQTSASPTAGTSHSRKFAEHWLRMLMRPFVAVYLEVAEQHGSPYGLRDFYSFLKMLRAGVHSADADNNEVSEKLPAVINCEATVSTLLVYVIQRNFGSVREKSDAGSAEILSDEELKIWARLRNIASKVQPELDLLEQQRNEELLAATEAEQERHQGAASASNGAMMLSTRPAPRGAVQKQKPRVRLNNTYCKKGEKLRTKAYSDPQDSDKVVWVECDEHQNLEVYALYRGTQKLYHPDLNEYFFGKASLVNEFGEETQIRNRIATYMVRKTDRIVEGLFSANTSMELQMKMQKEGAEDGAAHAGTYTQDDVVTYTQDEVVDYLVSKWSLVVSSFSTSWSPRPESRVVHGFFLKVLSQHDK